jgi:hypothetical protein
MAALTSRQRVTFVALVLIYAAIAVPLGVHKGDDIMTEIGQAQRLLSGQMINTAPPGQGMWWPPFALIVVAPFAALAGWSMAAAKAAWGALGMAALAWSVYASGQRWGWRAAALAFAVVVLPIHNNFHHLNIETLLLALLVATAADLAAGRAARAGAWAGLATALKVFPGLVLVYFALRRQWKALGVGLAVAAGATLVGLVPYGPLGMIEAIGNWVTLALHGHSYGGGSIAGFHMQKLGRLGYALGGAPISIVVLHLLAVGLVLATLARRPPTDDPPLEVGSVTLLAVLLTPIAWLHTFTLGYLAWVAAFAYPPGLTGRARTVWRVALGLVALHASTAASLVRLPAALHFFTFYNDTIGALLVLGLLLAQRRARIGLARIPEPRSPLPV